ncbi:MAG: conjugal transfer protein MobA [Paludibacter sp.]|nr:conjugal transfer protein MobA [Paludibacter sp.]
MKKEETKKPVKGNMGRNPKSFPAKFRYTISLNEIDNASFLTRFEESGMRVKAHFITTCIFNKTLRVVKMDKGTLDFYMRLTTFYAQYRAIGVNYNQAVKALKTNFGEKKALIFISKLEKATLELVLLNRQIMDLIQELEYKIYGVNLQEPLSNTANEQEE